MARVLSTLIAVNVPVLPLLKVNVPALTSPPTFRIPAVKVDPGPVTVTVPLPLLPMFTCAVPLERLPPVETVVVLPPPSDMTPVVENVEPAPVTEMVEAVLFVNAPVMTASP